MASSSSIALADVFHAFGVNGFSIWFALTIRDPFGQKRPPEDLPFGVVLAANEGLDPISGKSSKELDMLLFRGCTIGKDLVSGDMTNVVED